MFLMIENFGVCSLEEITLLGLSTTRTDYSNTNLIGMFGSGSKYAISYLLRQDIPFYVFLGRNKCQFFKEPTTVKDKTYNQVSVRISGEVNKTVRLGFVSELGEIDWKSTYMALREIMSNAIDATIKEYGDKHLEQYLKYYVVDDSQVRARSGYTRWFIALTPEVQEFYKNINKYFLHFDSSKLSESIIPNVTNEVGHIYKKGVLVGTTDKPSLFHYNIQDIELDESRNMKESDMRDKITVCLGKTENLSVIERLLKTLLTENDKWERSLPYYYTLYNSSSRRENYQKAFRNLFGDKAVLLNNESHRPYLESKGYQCIPLNMEDNESRYIYLFLQTYLPTADKILTKVEAFNYQVEEPTEIIIRIFNKIWDWIVDNKLNNNRHKPELKIFIPPTMEGGTIVFGMYEENTVYINKTICGEGYSKMLGLTIIEELSHHITKAADCTRDLQTFGFSLATTALEEVLYF